MSWFLSKVRRVGRERERRNAATPGGVEFFGIVDWCRRLFSSTLAPAGLLLSFSFCNFFSWAPCQQEASRCSSKDRMQQKEGQREEQ